MSDTNTATADECRNLFIERGLTYKDITPSNIFSLVVEINQSIYKNEHCLKMGVSRPIKKKMKWTKTKGLHYCYIEVDGPYFSKREAISFNTEISDGVQFIGFCGWASGCNSTPFLEAFTTWVEKIKPINNEQ